MSTLWQSTRYLPAQMDAVGVWRGAAHLQAFLRLAWRDRGVLGAFWEFVLRVSSLEEVLEANEAV